ncbi:hypothetical protein [Glycomyces artemisiae]|uniref:Uncharacterized protein n=1 Tax=Glycomyces artemisiae TaxID=1076443 RepID=A0A2T0UEY4_9ACTN|nr:hypothetical protein [Glycomyces artemisiae]PRY56408.1 hypothetical protein B0I28_10957 [Glycomyces artemisiae]
MVNPITPTRDQLIATRDELRAQSTQIRRGSTDLAGNDLEDAQRQHRRLMTRISELNDAIRNR